MSATELATPSPKRGLARLRRNKGRGNASTTSLSSTGEDLPDGDALRSSMDVAFAKVKERVKRTGNDRRRGIDSSNRRLSTLIPGRRKGSKKDDSDPPTRNPSVQSDVSANRSDASLQDGSGSSSLMTEDYSDTEVKPTRPTISPHQSHSGYLTLSSPLIHAQTKPSPASDSNLTSTDTTQSERITRILSIVEPAATERPADPLLPDRTQSPVGKFKEAFSLNRKKSGDDKDSVKSGGGGVGGLSGLLRSRSRRGSLNTQDTNEVEQSAEAARSAPALVPHSEPEEEEERPATPKQSRPQRIDTKVLPATLPSRTATPTTLVTPPTPTDFNSHGFPKNEKPPTSAPKLSSIESIRHRRAQSANLPSKLSNSIPATLTPTIEETKTPGGTLTSPANATGFFSNFLTATQKAADQLSNSINTSIGTNIQKGKATATGTESQEQVGEKVVPGVESKSGAEEASGEKRQRAVDTIGKGDLSLSQLGITESREVSPMTSATNLSQQDGVTESDESANKAEEAAAARAVSVAYEKPVTAAVAQATGGRPSSIASNDRLTLRGDQTPPRPTGGDAEGIKRSGSVRSRLSGRRRRHRASSATTGGTIATALHSSLTGLSNLPANGSSHRLTGFAVASSKRNKDFHQLFRSVPEDDYLIEDYSAALQRDILLHGRLYVSEGHVCFSSNILGWVTNLVISFDEVVSVEKKSTAVIFPNAIVIQTLQARNTFASFVARDSTYELLIGIWKINHPNLKSSLNGVTLDDAGTGDKTEKAESLGSEDGSEDGSDDEVYDEDIDDDDKGSYVDADRSAPGSEIGDTILSRKTSAAPVNGVPQANGTTAKGLESADAVVTGAAVSAEYPGSPTHMPTECADATEHYDRPLTDTTIPAPLGKVYSMMFGPASGGFMRKWMLEDQKARELEYPDDKTGLDNDHKTFSFSYIKPLNAPVGPKQTKCLTENTLEAFDLEKAVTVNCSTQTPDVPSGSVFTTKTKYCLMWGPENCTRMIANCTIEWTGKSWLKGPIEKGAQDGQTQYVKDIVAALKAAVTTKPPVKGIARNGRRKGKREVFDATAAKEEREVAKAKKQEPNWGLFEPARPLIEPLVSLIRPFANAQVVIAVLLVLLASNWLFPARTGTGVGFPGNSSPAELAAYEEMWRREESELWDWLEDRIGLDEFHASKLETSKERQKVLSSRDMGKKVEDERMNDRQVDDAIRVTEERLAALKEAVARKKGKRMPMAGAPSS